MKLKCVILGGGGHARVLIDCLVAEGKADPVAVLDKNSSLWGEAPMGVPILGDDNLLPELIERGVDSFVVGLGSIGDYHARQRLFDMGVAHHLKPLIVKHPTATCSQWAEIGAGTQLLPGSIVNAGAQLGANIIVNSGAIIEHDCTLADHVHVATGARLASTVRVERGAHIGAGAVVRQCLTIGEGALIGAGAVVISDVPPQTVVVGVPARPLKSKE